MSIIHDYRNIESEIERLQQQLEKLKGSEQLQKELEFEKKLRDLMEKHQKSLRDVISLLDPDSRLKGQVAGGQADSRRKPRQVKTYKNPHNGEVIETKGGNHSGLKAWKAEYGAEVVESWLQ